MTDRKSKITKSLFPHPKPTNIILILILGVALSVRIINLNHNSPFSDESIYIVIGKMGLFEHDWWTLNVKTWMAGNPYLYPIITAIAYEFGGIAGSRLVNVFLGVGLTYCIYWITKLLAKNQRHPSVSGLISAFLIAVSPVSIYISRLATYDAPSYFFLFLAISLLLASQQKENQPKLYFFSALCTIASYLTKIITVIYIPFLILFSAFQAQFLSKDNGNPNQNNWKLYYLLPLAVFGIIYALLDLNTVIAFLKNHLVTNQASLSIVIDYFYKNLGLIWLPTILGGLGLLFSKRLKSLFSLLFLGLTILFYHLLIGRTQTLDKHTFLAAAFMIIVAGLGIGEIMDILQNKFVRALSYLSIMVMLIIFASISYKSADYYNKLWFDDKYITNYMIYVARPGDKFLAEIGPSGMLALYNYINPANYITFDWFVYGNLTNEDAYRQAIKDGYFNYIQLTGDKWPKSRHSQEIHQLVLNSMDEKYNLIYERDDFYIYKLAGS